jgi:hypothetical protein
MLAAWQLAEKPSCGTVQRDKSAQNARPRSGKLTCKLRLFGNLCLVLHLPETFSTAR